MTFLLCRFADATLRAYGSEEKVLLLFDTQILSLVPRCGTREHTGLTSGRAYGAGVQAVPGDLCLPNVFSAALGVQAVPGVL